MNALHSAAAGLLLAALALPAGAAEKEKVETIPVKVKTDKEMFPTKTETDGATIEFETMDGRAHFALEGRFQFDTMFYDGIYNDALGGGSASDTKTRRMRLGVGGGFDKDWEWLYVIDVNNDTGKATLDTGQITYKGWSWADLNVGRFKRPFLLDTLNSSKWLPLVERSLIYDLTRSHVSDFQLMLSKAYDVGEAGKASWFGSIVQEGVEDYAGAEDASGRDRWQLYGRGAWAPWVHSGDVLHFGLGLGVLNPAEGSTIDIGTRLGVSSADLHTASYTVDGDSQLALEGLWIKGPFSLQSEVAGRHLELTAGGSADITASYLMATWTLTGESRTYKAYWARPDRVVPSGAHSFGAVELVARVEHAELEQPGTNAATADLVTLGANWHINTHLELMLNVLSAKTENFGTGEDSGKALSTRLAFQF